MGNSVDVYGSGWWSNLLDFGQDVLKAKRIKLGLSQFYISSKVGLNQSEISRIENGLARPNDIPTYELICRVYQLTNQERQNYSQLIYGSSSINNIQTPIIELLKSQAQVVYETSRSAQTSTAIKMSTVLRQKIMDLVNSNGYEKDLFLILGRLVLEESVARWDSDTSVKTQESILNIVDIADNLSSAINPDERSLSKYCSLTRASLDYITGKFKNAQDKIVNIGDFEKSFDEQWNLETLRMSLICASKTKNYKQFKFDEIKILGYLNKLNDPMAKTLLLEGLARAYSEFMPDEAILIMNDCQNYLQLSSKAGSLLMVRKIQADRSYAEIMLKAGKVTLAKKIAEKTAYQAGSYGLLRYETQAKNLLKHVD